MINDHSYPSIFFPKVNGQFIHNNNRAILTDEEDHALYSLHRADALTNANRKGYFENVEIFELVFQYRVEFQQGNTWQKMRHFRTLLAGEVGFYTLVRRASFSSLADYTWRLIDINSGEVLRQEVPSEWMVKND